MGLSAGLLDAQTSQLQLKHQRHASHPSSEVLAGTVGPLEFQTEDVRLNFRLYSVGSLLFRVF